jgi:hypothetical protein
MIYGGLLQSVNGEELDDVEVDSSPKHSFRLGPKQVARVAVAACGIFCQRSTVASMISRQIGRVFEYPALAAIMTETPNASN